MENIWKAKAGEVYEMKSPDKKLESNSEKPRMTPLTKMLPGRFPTLNIVIQ